MVIALLYASMEDMIGGTPLLELRRVREKLGLSVQILAKIESRNPGGSVKDRVARNMIDEAEKKGRLRKGSVIIEPTSGNTGIGLCAIGAARGYRVFIVMPDSMSIERQKIMSAYGAELVLTPGKEGMSGAIRKAEELAGSIPDSFIPGQFVNPDNPMAHYLTTGPEIEKDTEGKLDFFVAGVGTGGTISGTGRYLKEKHPALQVIAVEPASSAVLSGKEKGVHGIQGIGAGFVPEALDTGIYDEVVPVTDEDAYTCARLVAHEEGLLVGISAGAALAAAVKLGQRKENYGKTLVVLFPDSGERYLSTPLYT